MQTHTQIFRQHPQFSDYRFVMKIHIGLAYRVTNYHNITVSTCYWMKKLAAMLENGLYSET